MEVLLISDFEKQIYNSYLATFKKEQGKPFKIRKNFENVDESTAFLLKKLSIFFGNYKTIKLNEFFAAPYRVYSEKYFDLSFYITPKATKAYTLYQRKLQSDNPDSTEVLEFTLSALKFIKNYCKEKNIKVSEYIDYKNNTIPAFITHLAEHNVNFYSLFGFNSFPKRFKELGYEYSKFVLGDIVDSFDDLYNNFVRSQKNKILVREGVKKIVD